MDTIENRLTEMRVLCVIIFSDGKDVDCRIVKDIVCFHAANFQQVVEKLMLDLHEPPTTQVL